MQKFTNNTSRTLFQFEIGLLNNGDLPPNWSWVASSPNTKVATDELNSVYYKEFLPRSRLESIKSMLRGSRCSRSVKLATLLRDAGFNTPAIVTSGTLSQGRDYLFSEGIPAVGLTSYMASYLRQTKHRACIKWKRQVIYSLGAEIGRLHSKNIIHGDLRPNNVLIKLGVDKPIFYFIDNERTYCWMFKPPENRIVKNLIQIGMLFPIDISATDRLRFWKAYCKANPRYAPYQKQTSFMKNVYDKTINRLTRTAHYKPRDPDLPMQHFSDGLVVPGITSK